MSGKHAKVNPATLGHPAGPEVPPELAAQLTSVDPLVERLIVDERPVGRSMSATEFARFGTRVHGVAEQGDR